MPYSTPSVPSPGIDGSASRLGPRAGSIHELARSEACSCFAVFVEYRFLLSNTPVQAYRSTFEAMKAFFQKLGRKTDALGADELLPFEAYVTHRAAISEVENVCCQMLGN